MPKPKLPEYPKPMFKLGDPVAVYARNEKHEDELAAQGFSERRDFVEFPKMLFLPEAKRTGDPTEKARIVVNSAAEQEEAFAKGYVEEAEAGHYGEDLSGNKELPLPAAEAGSTAALQAQIDALQQQLLAQSQQNAEILKLVAGALDKDNGKGKAKAKAKE